MAFWALLVAVGARLFDDGVVLGFRPGDLSSLVFGAVVGTAVLAWRELSGRVRRGS